MECEQIRKRPEDCVGANLLDYEEYARTFSWAHARALLEGLPNGGLNIAHEAVDRHVLAGRGGRLALRWIGRYNRIRDFSYAALHAQMNRFANILVQRGITKGDRVFSLVGRSPELYIAALGTLKNGCVFSPLFSAFGPDPVKARMTIGNAKALVTSEALYRRKIEPWRKELAGLEHVFLTDLGVAGRTRMSPAARRLAEMRRVDPSAITGSGSAGAITYADVERRIGEITAPLKKKRAPGLDLEAMRTAIAAAMARSKREIPHYYLEHQVDVTACEQWLTRTNAARPPDHRLLIGALAVKAVALAARRFPAFNGFYRDGKFEPAAAVHVGVAISIRGGGLVAPALHGADQVALDELMTRMRDLVQRIRAGRIRNSELSDPTITVSSLGERGVEALYGIIYPPQVAIVGFGKVVVRPWVIDGAIEPRSVVTVTLSADHRVSDGHSGALFLAEISKLLGEPDSYERNRHSQCGAGRT